MIGLPIDIISILSLPIFIHISIRIAIADDVRCKSIMVNMNNKDATVSYVFFGAH